MRHRWEKSGQRGFKRSGSGLFEAIIFGSPLPKQFWAWAVWSSGAAAEGVEFSLKRARHNANEVIERLEANK